MSPKDRIIKYETDKGALGGFVVGCGATVIGIPVLIAIGLTASGKVSEKNGKNATKLLAVIGAPGLLVGAVCMGIGAGIGNIVGRIKAANK
jgi:hypothetical protein